MIFPEGKQKVPLEQMVVSSFNLAGELNREGADMHFLDQLRVK